MKDHFKRNKENYVRLLIAIGVASFTYSIMKRMTIPISSCATGTASLCDTETGGRALVDVQNSTLNNVSIFSSHRQGSPSWIVKCFETGETFRSQREAAKAMDIKEYNISKHLNGLQENAEGYHFSRIAIAA